MTLGMAWIRVAGETRELVVASDSRLSGGQYWDSNPKIMILPRTDSVISFAGSTADAYPLMLQAWNSVFMYPPAKNRAMDITDLKGHLVRVFNHSRKFISGLPAGYQKPDAPEALFMLSGYSWKTEEFKIWTLHFDSNIGEFTFRPASPWKGQSEEGLKKVAYIGDADCVLEAKSSIIEMLREREKLSQGSLNMEPFEALRNIIRSGKYPSVGGAIQLVKIYTHSNVAPVGVLWPDRRSEQVCILGRPLMKYEKTSWGVIDPDDPERAHPPEHFFGESSAPKR